MVQDESHFLKSAKAKRTQAMLPLLQAAARAILLSGTPALSRPMELFTQVQAIHPKLFPNLIAYGRRYCAGVHVRACARVRRGLPATLIARSHGKACAGLWVCGSLAGSVDRDRTAGTLRAAPTCANSI